MLAQATLKAQLVASMQSASTEAEGIANFAAAYGTYAAAAVAAPSPIAPSAVAIGKGAMQVAMVGIGAPGAGVAKLVAGIVAFWGGVAAGVATSFPTAVGIIPPPLAGLAAALAAAFAANVAEGATLDGAMERVATAIHGQTIIGGIVTYPGPVASPIL